MNMRQISVLKKALEARVLSPGYVTTERDVAESAELVNQYIDELERLEIAATVRERTILIVKHKGVYKAVEQ